MFESKKKSLKFDLFAYIASPYHGVVECTIITLWKGKISYFERWVSLAFLSDNMYTKIKKKKV